MKKIIIELIKLYQLIPFSSHHFCNFTPTCSEYMKEAIENYGVKNGLILGLKRIIKCRPHGKFGYDPLRKEEL